MWITILARGARSQSLRLQTAKLDEMRKRGQLEQKRRKDAGRIVTGEGGYALELMTERKLKLKLIFISYRSCTCHKKNPICVYTVIFSRGKRKRPFKILQVLCWTLFLKHERFGSTLDNTEYELTLAVHRSRAQHLPLRMYSTGDYSCGHSQLCTITIIPTTG